MALLIRSCGALNTKAHSTHNRMITVGTLKRLMEGLHDSSPVLVPSHDEHDHFLHAPQAAVEQVAVLGRRENTFAEAGSVDDPDVQKRSALVIR